MSQQTSIEWTDLSWNPVHGCSKVSPGCAHCYAETLSLRYGHTRKPWTPANAAENVLLKPHKLREPLSGAKHWQGLGAAAAAAGKTDGKLVFVNSTSDLFHERVPDEYIARVFAVMAGCPQHTFQILTKRPERMRSVLNSGVFPLLLEDAGMAGAAHDDVAALPNVWLGVSIENRRFVHRADVLRDTPAAVRFISAEPLLGPLVHDSWPDFFAPTRWSDDYDGPELNLERIDWVICGGESGHPHRPMRESWARRLRYDCELVGVPFFMKQMGGARPGDRLEDMPDYLRVRQFPRRLEVPA